ncbi:MAG: type II secretion system major pseudopilin GspG [Lysobacterales bacterium]
MMQRNRGFTGGRRLGGNAGFSLVELIAVVLLLGMIAGFVVPQVTKNFAKGKWNATRSKVAALSGKVENYTLDVGQPPSQLQDLLVKPGDAENWNGPYARESDLKDAWNRSFEYKAPGEHGEYDLSSLGSDGQAGGEQWAKDIGNWE